MSHPGDVGPLLEWWEGAGRPRVRAILGKTEGNGCVNDFSRGYATAAIKGSPLGPEVCVVMSGGTEGVLTPHFVVLAEETEEEETSMKEGALTTLSVGVARTREFLPSEIGSWTQAVETKKAVVAACVEANVDPAEAKFAQVKCPLLTSERYDDACVTKDTYESMAWSRRASALGVGLATGEVAGPPPGEGKKTSSWVVSEDDSPAGEESSSSIASTSAGVELLHSEIVVLGNGSRGGRYRAAGGVMNDAADLPSIVRCLEGDLRLTLRDGQLEKPEVIAAVLCKADPAGDVRGHRTTMLTDSDINATRHARAAVGGLLAGVFGDTRLFVSGGAEAQGPHGGGPFLILAEV